MGLARPDRPMAGLDPEFAFRRNDVPPVPKDDGPGRALPDSVLAALITALDRLEASAGRDVAVAVQLLIDTGRRPAEICLLPWDCLDQDRDGKYALIYTDFKNNRAGRRLAISDATAERDRRTQTAGAGTLPGHPAGRSGAAAQGIPQPRRAPSRSPMTPSPRRIAAGSTNGAAAHAGDGTEFDKAAVVPLRLPALCPRLVPVLRLARKGQATRAFGCCMTACGVSTVAACDHELLLVAGLAVLGCRAPSSDPGGDAGADR